MTESARLHPLRDRRPQIRLHRLWSERALHRVPREPRVARAVEPEEPPRDRVLAHEVAAEEPRVVGVDRYAHARLPELSQRMRVERRDHAEAEIRRRAARERHTARRERA